MFNAVIRIQLTLSLICLTYFSFAQSNFELGEKAFKNEQYQEATSFLTKAVHLDKFELSGKDLSMAYSYLALIRTAHLEKSFGSYKVSEVLNNHGNIKQAIDEMSNALHYQNNSSKALMNKTAEKLTEISVRATTSIIDTLSVLNPTNSKQQIEEMSHFLIFEFDRIEKISGENWELENVLGIAHYYVGEEDIALNKFNKARSIFAGLDIKPASSLQLLNYVMSCEYLFDEQKDLTALDQLLGEGIDYIEVMLSQYDQGKLDGIKELTKKENRLQYLKSKLSN